MSRFSQIRRRIGYQYQRKDRATLYSSLENLPTSCFTSSPSSSLERKKTINSWKCHALCDSVLSCESNRWEFEHVIRNNMGNEILSIYNDKHFEIWAFTRKIIKTFSYLVCPLWFLVISAVLSLICYHWYSCNKKKTWSSSSTILRSPYYSL